LFRAPTGFPDRVVNAFEDYDGHIMLRMAYSEANVFSRGPIRTVRLLGQERSKVYLLGNSRQKDLIHEGAQNLGDRGFKPVVS
jgi:hypothetical protein